MTKRERSNLSGADYLTGLFALDEVLDLYTNIPAQDLGYARGYVTEKALQKYPYNSGDKLLVSEPSERYKQRPELTSIDYGTAVTVFDEATKRQDSSERILVRAALVTRQEELGKKEQEKALLEARRTQAAITKENERLKDLILTRKSLTTVGWSAGLGIFSYPANPWVGGICGALAGGAFTVRSMVKESIGEITEKQEKRKAIDK